MSGVHKYKKKLVAESRKKLWKILQFSFSNCASSEKHEKIGETTRDPNLFKVI
jgi:hypothetical protein